jgi:RimJ/RimL family protein N-acetyltransferase
MATVAACEDGRVPPELTDLTWPRRTPRLSVRPARAEDAAELWSWYRLPEVTQWLSEHFPDEARFFDFYAGRFAHYLVAELDGRLVANAKLEITDCWTQAEAPVGARQAEIGWALDPAVQGRGLGTELARELLAISFDGLGLHRVTAICFADNTASMRIMEKIGMRLEARFVADSLHRSEGWLDSLSYGLLASEWRAGRTA